MTHFLKWPIFEITAFMLARGPAGTVAAIAMIVALPMVGNRLIQLGGLERSTALLLPRVAGYLLAAGGGIAVLSAGFFVLLVLACMWFMEGEYPADYAAVWRSLVCRYLATGTVLGIALGISGRFLLGRYVEPALTSWLHGVTRAQLTEGLTDVRAVHRNLPPSRNFDPRKYLPQAYATEAMFLGLNADGRPICISRSSWKSRHVELLGTTGSGKGLQASVALCQSLAYGDGVVVFDPKNDEWAPHVLAEACRQAKVPFRLLDLRDSVARFNVLRSATAEEIEELLIASFSLGRTGEAADFYRTWDRRAAAEIAKQGQGHCLASLSDNAASILPEQMAKAAAGLIGQLEEISRLKVARTTEGFDLSDLITRGGCLYVIGSVRHEAVVTLQRMVLIRLLQLIEGRRRDGRQRHVTIFLDEFRYTLSSVALGALATIRDKGANLLLAHQSLGDFAACGPILDEKSVRASVVDNTGLKFIYRTKDELAAQWVSGQTGKIQVTQEQRLIERNPELAETIRSARTAQSTERPLIDTNMVQHLPEGCAVFISDGMAQIVHTAPMPATKRPLEPLPPAPRYCGRPRAPGSELL